MTDFAKPLKDLKSAKKFLVAIDSDGCAFDAMGIKQRECFCPWMIGCFGLQPVAEAARECKDFADLFSKTRGANRHKTIVRILTELLPSHPKVKESGFKVPQFEYYCKWVNDPNSLLSNDGLKQAIAKATDPKEKAELEITLDWSKRVNQAVADIVKNVPPFKYVRESLEEIVQKADIIVCSATPTEALEREWAEHGIAKYAKVIAGQEMGSKADHLEIVSNGKYDKDKVLMVGDAPGDMKAAQKNKVLFFPVNPGNEVASWKKFHDEAFDRFINGRYAGSYEKKLIEEFDACLPENPPWLE
jgi:phosphoglycolate phosphatase-like HAD superfamily hydrolase